MSDAARITAQRVGDAVEADTIQRFDALEPVADDVATWHDARTVALLEPSEALLAGGTCHVESDTTVEIKGCFVETGNGDRTTAGRWYVKRDAHEQLLEAGGVYLLVVSTPRPSPQALARMVVPASILDEHLRGRWYDVDADRSEDEVAKLAWHHVVPEDAVSGGVLDAR